MSKNYLYAFLCLFLPGCHFNRLEKHKNQTPHINFQKFFNGKVEGQGTIFNFMGNLISSFDITMIGNWKDGNQGTLKEHFSFHSGKKLYREWMVTFHPDNTYTATADDLVGTAKGVQSGNAAWTDYKIKIPYNGYTFAFKMDDWSYQVDEKTIFNRAIMKKFGIKVAELIIVLKK